jgi:hypothetical protein
MLQCTGVKLDRTDRRIAIAIFVIVAVGYGYFFGGGGWNQNSHFALTRAIVEDGTLHVDPYVVSSGDLARGRGGHFYANKAPGLSILGLPPFATVRAAAGAGLVDLSSYTFFLIAAWFATFAICGGGGALLAAAFFLYARSRFDARRRFAAIVAFALAFGTNLFGFSTLYFAHVPSAALHFVSFVLVISGAWPFLAGLAAGAAGATNYLLVPFAALLAVIFFVRTRSAAGLARFVGGAALPAIGLALYHWRAFGSPFRTAMETMNPAFVSRDALFLGIVELPKLSALSGITVSPYRGLLYLSPFLAFAILGIVRFWRARELRIDFSYAVFAIVFFLLFNSSFNGWEGGFSIGPRYLIPIIPFVATFLLMVRWKKPVAVLFALAVAVSCVHNFAATAVDPQPSGSIASPLEEYIYPLLTTGRYPDETLHHRQWIPDLYGGHTSVNRQTILEKEPFILFAPGSAAAEWASANLGELIFGPGHPASLLPVLLWIAGGFVLLLRMTAKEDG